MSRTAIIFIIIILLGAVGIYWWHDRPNFQDTNRVDDIQNAETMTVASNLNTPWEIAPLPQGDIIVTERSGTLRVIGNNPLEIKVPGVAETGEGGLLGLALHPDYSSNNFIYLYFTVNNQGKTNNRVTRYIFKNNSLSDSKIIIDNIPASENHNGGRIAFGPDQRLYITTGDASNENLAQDKNSLAGKILRLKDDGTIPPDNPFGNAVYSYGHRNPQGLAWDKDGGMWATEHGLSGLQSGLDEINYIEKGGNYGWPLIEGDETREGMKTPAINSGTDTWAPAGLIYYNEKLYFAGLRGKALYELPIISKGVVGDISEYFKNEFGRLRAVALDKEDGIFISTSNRDERGDPTPDDDKIIKLMIF